MKYRLVAAIVCTASSFIGLVFSFTTPFINPLWVASWAIYFVILYFWIKDNRAPKALMITGTIMGVISVVSSIFYALFFVFPSIALMIHVIKCTFFSKPPNIAVKQTVP